jgi:hypothetical protein
MSKHDLQARPIYHHKRESIDAHLTVVFAALAVSKFTEAETAWSIKKLVRTARRYRTIEIQAGNHTISAADPLPEDLAEALHALRGTARADSTCPRAPLWPPRRAARPRRRRSPPTPLARGCANLGQRRHALARGPSGPSDDPRKSIFWAFRMAVGQRADLRLGRVC